MEVININVNQLTPYENNPRNANYQQLIDFLDEHLFVYEV